MNDNNVKDDSNLAKGNGSRSRSLDKRSGSFSKRSRSSSLSRSKDLKLDGREMSHRIAGEDLTTMKTDQNNQGQYDKRNRNRSRSRSVTKQDSSGRSRSHDRSRSSSRSGSFSVKGQRSSRNHVGENDDGKVTGQSKTDEETVWNRGVESTI